MALFGKEPGPGPKKGLGLLIMSKLSKSSSKPEGEEEKKEGELSDDDYKDLGKELKDALSGDDEVKLVKVIEHLVKLFS